MHGQSTIHLPKKSDDSCVYGESIRNTYHTRAGVHMAANVSDQSLQQESILQFQVRSKTIGSPEDMAAKLKLTLTNEMKDQTYAPDIRVDENPEGAGKVDSARSIAPNLTTILDQWMKTKKPIFSSDACHDIRLSDWTKYTEQLQVMSHKYFGFCFLLGGQESFKRASGSNNSSVTLCPGRQ